MLIYIYTFHGTTIISGKNIHTYSISFTICKQSTLTICLVGHLCMSFKAARVANLCVGEGRGSLASEHEAALNGRTSNSISLYKRLRLAKKAEKKQTKHAKTLKQIPTTL